ncbi:MAG: hypothetical protein HQL64_15960 [Magnetococcales bacterium]|nr:hypothetical protein [Magnetococcales bacterium]
MTMPKDSIKAVREKLANTRSGQIILSQLTEIERLQCDMVKLGASADTAPPLRLPYSSMPPLRSRCWK